MRKSPGQHAGAPATNAQKISGRPVTGSIVALSAERHGDDPLVLDRVAAGRARSDAAAEIGSAGEGGIDLGVVDIEAEREVLDRAPLRARTDIPEIKVGVTV